MERFRGLLALIMGARFCIRTADRTRKQLTRNSIMINQLSRVISVRILCNIYLSYTGLIHHSSGALGPLLSLIELPQIVPGLYCGRPTGDIRLTTLIIS